MAENFIDAGIEAFREHHLERAQSKFAKAVVADPNSQDAWLWLARVIADRDQRLYCYQRVLEINPNNAEAATAFQYVAVSARPPSVQRALALANSQPVQRHAPAPIIAPRSSPQTARAAAAPSKPVPLSGYVLLESLLILVFLLLYIVVQWNTITTQVQNVAITPATVITRAIFPTATAPRTPTTAPSPRPQTNVGRPSAALFAQAQEELDANNSQQVLDLLLPNLGELTEPDDLADAYYFIGRAELDLEEYRAAAGYFKKLYALDPSVEYLFMLAVANDLGGDSTAALESYTALAAWNGKDASLYHGLAERRVADLKQSSNAKTPTAAK